MFTSQNSTIQLLFEPTLKLPDEVIDGVVQLHFPSLIEDKIEEVHVKLRGCVYTEISRPTGTSVIVDTRRVHLIKEGLSLWNAGTYPPAGSDTLEIPFAFRLPSTLPPSFEYGDIKKSLERVRLRYAVEVVGKRNGLLRPNRRIIKPFPVLPPLKSGAELREALKRGWEGPWRSYSDNKSIRKGIWGDYSDVTMTLSLPEVDAFPVFAPIPFTITLTTHSKLTKRDDKSSEDAIFPTPPVDPHAVDFRLMRDVWLKAQSMDFTCTGKTVEHLGGLGAQKSPSEPNASVTVAPLTKVWIPEAGEKGGEKGRWKQEVTFKSTLQFSCTPTFTSETVDLSYKLKLHVDYPGIKNSQTIEVPVKIVSSMYPIGEQTWDGPPPDLALPPNYFQGTWEDDPNEKE